MTGMVICPTKNDCFIHLGIHFKRKVSTNEQILRKTKCFLNHLIYQVGFFW